MVERIFNSLGWGGWALLIVVVAVALEALLRALSNGLAWRRGFTGEFPRATFPAPGRRSR